MDTVLEVLLLLKNNWTLDIPVTFTTRAYDENLQTPQVVIAPIGQMSSQPIDFGSSNATYLDLESLSYDVYVRPLQDSNTSLGWAKNAIYKIRKETERILKTRNIIPGGIFVSPIAFYLPLDENSGITAYDHSGNSNNGIISGSTWVTGKMGSALFFNGLDNYSAHCPACEGLVLDYIKIPDNTKLNVQNNQFSLSVWIKRTALQADYSWWIDKATLDSSGYYMYTEPNNTNIIFAFHGNSSHNELKTNINIGEWTHIAVTLGGTIMTLYKNGIYVDSLNTGSTVVTNTNNLWVGSSINGTYGVNGIVDELRFYNRALAQNEITDLYNNSLSDTNNKKFVYLTGWRRNDDLTKRPVLFILSGQLNIVNYKKGI